MNIDVKTLGHYWMCPYFSLFGMELFFVILARVQVAGYGLQVNVRSLNTCNLKPASCNIFRSYIKET